MELAQRITKAREEKGLNQAELAALIGVAPSNVSRWESDRYKPNRDTLVLIAGATGCDLGWLITGREPSPPPPAMPPDEATLLDVYRALGLTMEQAIRGLSWAAAQTPTLAPTDQPRLVAVRDETNHQLRLQAERRRKEREAAREAGKDKQSTKAPDRK